MAEERFYSVGEVAGLLHVDRQTVRRWIHSGRLPAIKPGLEYRVAQSDLDELLRTRSSKKAQAPSLQTSPSETLGEAEAGHQRAEDPKEAQVQEIMKRPSFWEAIEKMEELRFGSEAVDTYIAELVNAYEEELADPNSPYFRDANAAALWTATLHLESSLLARMGFDEVKAHMKDIHRMSSEEKGAFVVSGLKHIARRVEALESLRRRADERVAAMQDQPDELEQERLEKARQEAEEAQHQSREGLQQELAGAPGV